MGVLARRALWLQVLGLKALGGLVISAPVREELRVRTLPNALLEGPVDGALQQEDASRAGDP